MTQPPAAPVNLRMLLQAIVERGASDLHLCVGTAPQLRIDGSLQAMPLPPLSPEESKNLCYSVLTDVQRRTLEERLSLDLSFGVKGLARFRANIFFQRGALSGAFRLIPFHVRKLHELGAPKALSEIALRPRGLVLITGPTGSGKSTTLAAMIDEINADRHCHIVTVEDPIEYVHPHKSGVVSQREIGSDAHNFKEALKYILRQDPDVVLIGEMRDLETVEAAITIAETGHLTFATLHTNSTAQTMHRIIDVFPAVQQPQIRAQLAMVLEAVMCQQLLPKVGGGRVLATEFMRPNAAIRALIREDKIHQIYTQIQIGRAQTQMHTMNQSIAELVQMKKIDTATALEASSDPDELRRMLA